MGERDLPGVRGDGGIADGAGQFDVEGVGGDQPDFGVWGAVADFGVVVHDAVDLCAAPAGVSVLRVFFLGICSTIHQTLIVALLGMEIGIAVTQPKLGRDLFLLNTLGWVFGG